ncbi:MAG TPA: hypothetical protein VLX30_11755 [Burkholderiales bacterium]|nr:hypothetical protein [Burkholderiales bacterium]
MKASIAIVVASAFATSTAFAQSVQPQTNKAPAQVAPQQMQVAQVPGGGMATGAGTATGAVGTTLSATAIVAVGAGAALVVGASGSNTTTTHH